MIYFSPTHSLTRLHSDSSVHYLAHSSPHHRHPQDDQTIVTQQCRQPDRQLLRQTFWGTWGITPRLGIGHYLLSHGLRHCYGNPSLLKNSICTITIISQQIYTRCHTYMHSQGPVSFPSSSQHINDSLLAHLLKYIHTPMHTPLTHIHTYIYIYTCIHSFWCLQSLNYHT